ncbi:hypothetical protein [Aliihoeflea sp. 40Bstr573]|uniref:hypothetical protein n=1 Tax=Aliihoeflea sp. 40Bstr573 TaxID=2696467 RepID=UPI002095F51C|nr:hypothetical protein [Aliihoeflea sp. 40Bstr573]MCO6386889.1 hypothetical protein [Aliihoeflea sp. 40Bstr573]
MTYFSDKQAKDIWKARWRGEAVQSLVARYGENPFRFYEVWSEERNEGSRKAAYQELMTEDPSLAKRTNPTPHTPTRRVTQRPLPKPDGQASLFFD